MIWCVFDLTLPVKYNNQIQPINIVESPWLKKIFLLLRQELKESDIPGHTTIRKRIEKVYQDYLKQLEEEMAVM
jgi:hypothetical protein